MTRTKQFLPDDRHDDALRLDGPENVSPIRQMDIKPTLKVLAGLCIFFGILAVAVGCGAALIVLLRTLARIL
jgi:hypothetical protein